MRWIQRTLCLFGILTLSAIAAPAQAPACPGPVAQITSPAAGSTLPAGSVTFQWCSANADYFVTIESVLGSHDIFNAIVRATSLTLAADCAATPPLACIPSNGETIYVTLWTQTAGGKSFQAAPVVVYTAASAGPAAPSPSITTAADATAMFSSSSQSLALSAAVTSSAAVVNQGTVTFRVLNGATSVGSPVASPTVSNGHAGATYLLPGGTAAASYTIQATYSGGTNFDPSSGTGTLTVAPGLPVAAPTTTTVTSQTAAFSSAAQDVTLTASVTSGSPVNEGKVTFQVVDSSTNAVGTAVTSATLNNGLASAVYRLPAGLVVGAYTIQAAYSGGTNFALSSGNGALTINPATPPGQNITATTASNNTIAFSKDIQHVTLTAAVEVPAVVVNEGTVTFQVKDGNANVGAAVPSAALTDGNASVSYALPAATAARTYTIVAKYSGGPDFTTSSGNATLSINKAQSVTQFTSTTPSSLAAGQTYTPVATSTGDGTLTIVAAGACSISNGVVTITATSGACDITATESDGVDYLGSSATQSIAVQPPDFSLATGTTAVTIGAAGGTGTITVVVTGQSGYNGTIAFTPASCTGLPAKSSCAFSPASVSGSGSTTVTISTAASQAANRERGLRSGWTAIGGVTLGCVLLVCLPGRRTRWSTIVGMLCLGLLLVAMGCASAGGSAGSSAPPPSTVPGTPSGSFVVTVTGVSGGLTHSTSFTLVVQ